MTWAGSIAIVPLRHEKPVDFFRRELTFTRDGVSSTVLDAAAVGSTVYAAVRNVNYPDSGCDLLLLCSDPIPEQRP